MKPLRIEIKDFGAITSIVIDLANVTMAAICGTNGAGKSTAFTIAPRFALFGAVKAGCSIDDMVRTGTTEASVAFDFEHHGAVWRVIRTRSTKGKGKTTLELQRQSGELWASESGASIAETQKKIIKLLNLDDETFVCSSMILQNKANEFTSRPAGQRKDILAQILQLDQYDVLKDKAKAKVQEVTIALEKCKTKIEEIDKRLADRQTLEADKFQAEIKIATLEAALGKLDGELQSAQMDYSTLVASIEQVDKLRQQAEALSQEVNVKILERDRQQRRLDTAKQLIDKEATILEKAELHEQTKEKVTVLRTKQEQQTGLKNEAARLNQELGTVESSIVTVIEKVTEIETTLANRAELEFANTEYEMAISSLAGQERRRTEYDQLMVQLNKAKADWQSAEVRRESGLSTKDSEIKSLLKRSEMLNNVGCINIDRANCVLLTDAKEAKSKAERLQSEMTTWNDTTVKDNQVLKTKADNIQTLLDSIGYDPEQYKQLQQQAAELKPKADSYAKLDGMIQLLESLKTQLTDLTTRKEDINARLVTMRQQYADLAKDLKELPELEARVKDLEPWLRSKEQLPAAKEVFKTATEMIGQLNGEIDAADKKSKDLNVEYEQLIGNSIELKAQGEKQLQSLKDDITLKRNDYNEATAKIGSLTARLDAMAQDEEQRLVLVQEMEPLALELTRWQTLVKAFSNNGIPALIIENAVPELERIANDILGQMTNGKNFLKFETQKELKSRSGMAETLDIIVGDWAGERIYETFSGGEQLRIDFAIRFALAELLARRAGDRVDWLTIDEGFGSQSEDYLPGVIDAVKAVASRFGIVLVISHVKAVQEAFEQKILFEPTEQAIDVMVA